MPLTTQLNYGIMITMENCRIKGCNMKFADNLQRALHEVNTWHCIGCGFSDNAELTKDNFGKICNLCMYDYKGNPTYEPNCVTILVDFKTKRFRRIRKKETNV